jgi:hypothetical protein
MHVCSLLICRSMLFNSTPPVGDITRFRFDMHVSKKKKVEIGFYASCELLSRLIQFPIAHILCMYKIASKTRAPV